VYASLVPLDYTPISWEEALAEWRRIPWLNLQLFQRGDWVANALVVLPSGILFAAAIDWGRPQRGPLIVAAPCISLFLAAVVSGIEFSQIWFPTRTKSLNDIAAGYVGAVLGPLLWIAFGRQIEWGVERFLTLPQFTDRLKWLCVGYLAFILVYSVLPLDMVLSRGEWQARLAERNIRWNPFDGDDAALHAVKGFLLGGARMVPVGLLLALVGRLKLTCWSLALLPVGLELLQLPIFSKYVSTMEIVGGWAGGGLGYVLGRNLPRLNRFVQQPLLWGVGWIVAFAAVLAALLLRHEQVLSDPAEIASRFHSAWDLPLVKYYSGSEYNAYTNILLKIAIFAALGAIAFGWQKTSSPIASRLIFLITLIMVVVSAFLVELLQVILPPLIPDISDAFTYLVGYAAGYQLTRVLWGRAPVTAATPVLERALPSTL
jgi:VanZ family protein